MSTIAALANVTSGRVGSSVFTRSLTHGSIILADLFGLAIAGSLAVFTRYFFHAQFSPGDYVSFTPAILIFFATFALSGLYPGVATSPIEEFRLILRASSISVLLLICITFFLRKGILSSRLVVVLAWILTIALVPISRRLMRGWCSICSRDIIASGFGQLRCWWTKALVSTRSPIRMSFAEISLMQEDWRKNIATVTPSSRCRTRARIEFARYSTSTARTIAGCSSSRISLG